MKILFKVLLIMLFWCLIIAPLFVYFRFHTDEYNSNQALIAVGVLLSTTIISSMCLYLLSKWIDDILDK